MDGAWLERWAQNQKLHRGEQGGCVGCFLDTNNSCLPPVCFEPQWHQLLRWDEKLHRADVALLAQHVLGRLAWSLIESLEGIFFFSFVLTSLRSTSLSLCIGIITEVTAEFLLLSTLGYGRQKLLYYIDPNVCKVADDFPRILWLARLIREPQPMGGFETLAGLAWANQRRAPPASQLQGCHLNWVSEDRDDTACHMSGTTTRASDWEGYLHYLVEDLIRKSVSSFG